MTALWQVSDTLLACLPASLPACAPPADRLLDTGNQDLILKMFRRFPKAGAGVARLQVRRPAAAPAAAVVMAGWRACAGPLLPP